MAMVRPSNLDGNPRGVISKRVTFNNNHSYSMFFWGGDNLNIDIVGTDNRFPSDSIFIENQWYLTEVLYNGNLPSSQRTSLYISGDLDKTVTENSGIINNFISDLTIAALNANYANTFEGDIAEVIIYRSALTSTQRIIVENYFAVKYGTDISSDKNYAYFSSYPNELGGIGQESSIDNHTEAQSDILNINSPSSIENGEYLLWGHNNADASTFTTLEPPNGDDLYTQRIAREWRIDVSGADTNPGTVTISVDMTGFFLPTNFTNFAIFIDADGDFTSGAQEVDLVAGAGNIYSATDVDLADGDVITVGAINRRVIFSATASHGLEDLVPFPDIGISLTHPYPAASGNDVMVDIIDLGTGTAGVTTSCDPGDATKNYIFTGTTATLTAGTSATTINPFSICNDSQLEIAETIIFKISNPTNADLGIDSVHTYTINDDDNPRKVYFSSASTNNPEGNSGTTIVQIQVEISSPDATNNTTVDYSVTGGTASGGGVDYTLAAGTAIISPAETTTNIDVSIAGDIIFENDETIIITLANPTNCNLSSTDPIEHSHTIANDDTEPVVEFVLTNSSDDESNSSIMMEVQLSAITGTDVTVTFTAGGTSTSGDDYIQNTPSPLIISSGGSIANISFTINDDNQEEGDETIVVSLSSAVNATLGSNIQHTYTIYDNDFIGSVGPGGVGRTDGTGQLILWLKGDTETFQTSGGFPAEFDGEPVGDWQDQSGYDHHVTAAGNERPLLRTDSNGLNGHPVVNFDGSDDFLKAGDSPDLDNSASLTIFTVVRPTTLDNEPRAIISKRVNPDNEQSYSLFYYTSDELFLDIEGTNDRFSTNTVFTENNPIIAEVVFDGNLTTNNRSKVYLNAALDVTSGESSSSIANNASDLTIGVMNEGYGTGRHLAGDIAECIVYNKPLNTAQRVIIENYLGAKYAFSISNDKFAHESTHASEVAGIGKDDADNFHSKARSSIAEISNPDDLGNSEYLLFGHNGLDLSAENNNIPVGVISRLKRIWRLDETGGDIGSITILFDVSGFSINSENDLELLVDSDVSFIDASRITTRRTYDAGQKTMSFITNLASGNFFTLASINADTPLPVQLSKFEATFENNVVKLMWRTESELNNIGFLVSRSTNETDSFKVIASFATHQELRGHSTKSSATNYNFIDKISLHPLETYYYKLWSMDAGGEIFELSPVVSVDIPIIGLLSYELFQNYPNPFNPATTISYHMKEAGIAPITVFDLNGRVVFDVSQFAAAGKHSFLFNGTKLASGTYFYRLNVEGHFQRIKRMMLIK